ncbi:[ribosomal protein S18]-alanine N-acetyltransferase [Candidatus Hakubella thermalkaliphila]|uniref:[ribosomal protein S18]-alanine N-acetyltransferase n=3 Tax=Candidatus Hakubella thermalkaliphila TaxID=2754717 RepID=A0A6V8QGQ1_9ACTN|nr:GNAT family N-acetyltransferase [Candidatus Hakubella thermalkaliphila]GFP28282.1 [ribosomal protein S18]-alanine N-acetyltransferase [Candidatus Hakubella thermalkaliphila]GFP36714.1 [ribosomal protein S18]-alanine N-acetyltransferase [Candidatus Hakubella thermalkaliphila]GFP39338.1 [ribosomal protein S18]-alanine N-acetyltransferase [Candidatus Hakubella thermalkaliphila]GFP43767.1 [ribosomal protein S18]-alanine N-acetyltransferase [Candidatus Hakubella thermalkaliphila]
MIRQADESCLRKIWDSLEEHRAVFKSYDAYLAFGRKSPDKIFWRRCLGQLEIAVMDEWRGQKEIGVIWLLRCRREREGYWLEFLIQQAKKQGLKSLVTSPLTQRDSRPFLSFGFYPYQHLDILRKNDLRTSPPTNTPVLLRPFQDEDQEELLLLDNRSFDQFWWMDEQSLKDIIDSQEVSFFYVAGESRKLRGYILISFERDYAHLSRIAVDPEYQGRGIASALLDRGIQFLRRRGVRSISVSTQANNYRSKALYRKFGFRETGESLCICRYDLSGDQSLSGEIRVSGNW